MAIKSLYEVTIGQNILTPLEDLKKKLQALSNDAEAMSARFALSALKARQKGKPDEVKEREVAECEGEVVAYKRAIVWVDQTDSAIRNYLTSIDVEETAIKFRYTK